MPRTASCPSTVAFARPLPTGPRTVSISHSSSSVSPGRTIRLKRTSSMPANSASLPAVLGLGEHRDRAALGERLDHLHPGHDRVAGEVAGAVGFGHGLPRDARARPGSSSSTSSMSSIGSRCGMTASIACLVHERLVERSLTPTAAPGARSGRGARSTWRCRRASRWPPRSRRTGRRTRPSGRRRAPGRRAAPRGSGRARGASPTRPARGSGRRRRRRADPRTSGSVRRSAAQRACATSLHVLTTRRCSQVAELRVAAELADPGHELRQRVLRRIVGILRVRAGRAARSCATRGE